MLMPLPNAVNPKAKYFPVHAALRSMIQRQTQGRRTRAASFSPVIQLHLFDGYSAFFTKRLHFY